MLCFALSFYIALLSDAMYLKLGIFFPSNVTAVVKDQILTEGLL